MLYLLACLWGRGHGNVLGCGEGLADGIHALHPEALGRCPGMGLAGPGELTLSSQGSKALSGAQQLALGPDRQAMP